jgi:hypothetical protein
VLQPDPTLQPRAGTLGTILASLGMTAVVVLVLYGLSRPQAPQQIAGAPGETSQTAPAPATTGQGQGGGQAGEQGGSAQKPQPEQGKGERSDSATTGAQPSDQPRPPQQ